MKSKLVLASLFLTITLFSCKDAKKEDAVDKKEKKVETFDVVLKAIVKQNDVFQLYYIDQEGKAFDDLKSIKVNVSGSETSQDIVFNLPEDVIPLNLRLDLGESNKQPEIKFNSLTFKYFNKKFVINSDKLLQYFVPGQLVFNPKTSIIKINQGSEKTYDPLLYPQSCVKDEIQKIIK